MSGCREPHQHKAGVSLDRGGRQYDHPGEGRAGQDRYREIAASTHVRGSTRCMADEIVDDPTDWVARHIRHCRS
jgi:hypothetical protein